MSATIITFGVRDIYQGGSRYVQRFEAFVELAQDGVIIATGILPCTGHIRDDYECTACDAYDNAETLERELCIY